MPIHSDTFRYIPIHMYRNVSEDVSECIGGCFLEVLTSDTFRYICIEECIGMYRNVSECIGGNRYLMLIFIMSI
jgi:hypothetical protein